MDAPVENERQDSLKDFNKTIIDYLSYLTTLWLTGANGVVRRSVRLTEKWRDAQLAAIETLTSEKGLGETSRSQVRILTELGDEWVEDMRNLAQVALMNQAEMQYWSRRFLQSSLSTVKALS